jgi:predicted DCC family thiol-disulfide oxidoreductase YuxK
MDKSILFYDGECGFCNKSVQLVLKWSKNKSLYFATLQGETALDFKKKFSSFPKDLQHIVYHHKNKLYFGAKGFFQIAKDFKYPYKLLSVLGYLPNFLTNLCYSLIAQNRYKFFGKLDACVLPDKKDRIRFLN